LIGLSWLGITSALGGRAHAQPSLAPPQREQPAAPAEPTPPGLTAPSVMPPIPPPTETVHVDYRYQLLATDAASIGLMLSFNKTAATAGGVGYLLGAPIIHGAHDEGGRALASFGIRLGGPVAGFLLTAALLTAHECNPDRDDGCDNSGDIPLLVLGTIVGAAAAVVIDDVLIAKPRTITRQVGLSLAPTVMVDRDRRTSIGIGGQF
jgi:hypothetical protein